MPPDEYYNGEGCKPYGNLPLNIVFYALFGYDLRKDIPEDKVYCGKDIVVRYSKN